MKKKTSNEWETLKSGVKRNGNWFALKYPTGWYFAFGTTKDSYEKHSTDYKTLGPFKTFEDGVKELEKCE